MDKNNMKYSIAERLQFGPDGKVIIPKLQPPRPSIHRRNSVESIGSSTCTSTSSEDNIRPRPLKRKRDVSLDGKSIYNYEYLVEKILAHKYKHKQNMFLVKWKGWSQEANTWEPLENLSNCTELLEEFLAESLEQKYLKELREILNITKNPTTAELERYIPKNGFDDLPKKIVVQRELLKLSTICNSKRSKTMLEVGKENFYRYLLYLERDKQLTKLKLWEEEMNATAKEDAILEVENNYDLEEPPQGFIYVNDYIPTEGITIPDEPFVGCDCKEGCNGRAKNCCYFNNLFPYIKKGRVNIIQGIPIYECNKLCTCDETCRNRVVQHGRKVPLCIFRTSTGCGWGVKTLRKIYAGEFVCEYVGEVVTFDEAERRGKGYDAEGRTYLFDLDFNSADFPYTVDAATYGNVAHFINHSCDPNLGVWAVWVNCLDPNLPKLALFAIKEIEKGEELTFDYMCNVSEKPKKKTVINSPSRQRLALSEVESNSSQMCRCGAKKCRRYLF